MCAKLDVLFGFESARRSIWPVLSWLFCNRLGKCDHVSTYFCVELASDIVRNIYVKLHSFLNPINTVINNSFTCQQILFWLPLASVSTFCQLYPVSPPYGEIARIRRDFCHLARIVISFDKNDNSFFSTLHSLITINTQGLLK